MKKMRLNCGIRPRDQIIRKMKVTVFLLTISILGAFASGTYSQTTKLTLQFNNTALEKVLGEIENQSEFRFFYNENVNVRKEVTVSSQNKSLFEVLDNILGGTGIKYRIIGRQIALYNQDESFNPAAISSGVQIQVQGRVTDSSGAPLPGVTVAVENTTQGTITDANGSYSLVNVPSEATLVFSFVGMKTQEILIAGKSIINILMEEETVGIEEVVAVGYGSAQKRDLTTAVSSVSSEQLEDIPVANASQALSAKMSGVQVQQTTGEPGSSPVIRIRGYGSISATSDPLYVIDGYPSQDAGYFNSLSPSDILRIDVLKDAASSAIYGSRGANGVILVTTKRGMAKGKADFNIDVYKGISQVSKKLNLLNAKEFVETASEAYRAGNVSIPNVFNTPSEWNDTDWQDVIFQNADIENYKMSATGGAEKIKYLFSGAYYGEEGIVIGNDFDRITFNAKIDAELAEKLSIGVDIVPSYGISDWKSNSGLISNEIICSDITVPPAIPGAIAMPPLIPIKYENGDYGQPNIDPYLKGTYVLQNIYNPLCELEQLKAQSESARLLGKLDLRYELGGGLSFNTVIGGTFYNTVSNVYRNSVIANRVYQLANMTTPYVESIKAHQFMERSYEWLWTNTLNIDRQYGNHSINGILGIEAQKNFLEQSILSSKDGAFSNDYIHNISNSSDNSSWGGKAEWSIASYIGRFSYDYKDKYYLSIALRRDESSRFGPESRVAYFPSLSFAWRMSDENFFLNISKWLSDIKLRGSYGKTGNFEGFGNYAWSASMGTTKYAFGQAIEIGYYPSGYADNALTWETTHQIDVGLDLGLLENRILLTIDAYQRNTDGLISLRPIPAIGGFGTSVTTNIGNIENKGLDIEFTSKNMKNILKWTTTFNISFNKNEVKKLVNDNIIYGTPVYGWSNTHRIMEGRPVGDIYGYQAEGIFRNQDEVNNSPQWNGNGSVPGDVKYKDVSRDGKITPDDITRIGNALPDFTYGMTNTFKIKSIDLSILLQGVQGGNIMNGSLRMEDTYTGRINSHSRLLERWQSERNPGNGLIPRLTTNPSEGGNSSFSSRHIFDASYLRIRSVVLGYTFTSECLEKFGMKKARVYLSAENLYTFSNYFGYSPEASEKGGSITQLGVDQGTYPLPRKIIVGLNVGF
jgi:TonB-linked SusC/RagA family outer membrane protein